MELTSSRKFSEQTDLLPILQDINNKEESIKWAWLSSISTVLCREGITVNTPIFGYKRCTEDGTVKIRITPQACMQMGFEKYDSMLGASLNIGIEAKRLNTKYSTLNSVKSYMNSAFAQRVWYDSKIYRNGFNTTIDAIGVTTEDFIVFAYKHKNKELYYSLLDYYDTHNITKACDIYSTYSEVKALIDPNIVWEPMILVDNKLSVEDIMCKLFTDMFNGGNVKYLIGGKGN